MAIQKYIISFLLLLSIFVGFFHPITAITQDLGRHILTGEIILQTHNVPKTNFYSYTYPTFPFINTHWGSEVLFYILSQTVGIAGLLLIMSILVVAAFAVELQYVFKKVDAIALGVIGFLYLGVLFERTDLRPELFSFLLTAIFVTILYKYREKYTSWIFLLIPLELLWTNLHVYFAIGITVIGLFFIDMLIGEIRKIREIRKIWEVSNRLKALGIVLAACIVVTVINPNGFAGTLYPLRVFENYGYAIEENQNIFFLWSLFQKPTIVFYGISVVVLFASLFLNIKKTKPIDWFLALFFALLGASAERNFPLFVFATGIPATVYLSVLVDKISKKRFAIIHTFLFFVLSLALCWQIMSVASARGFGAEVPKGAKGALDFVKQHGIAGPIFNNFDIGSYIEYRLYPKYRIFVDGRPEAYPKDFFQKTYIPMQEDPQLFESMDQKYHFNTIIFSHTDQTPWAATFIKDITKNPKWNVVYLDEMMIVLVKNIPSNQRLIQQYTISDNSNTPLENGGKQSQIQLALFYQNASWDKHLKQSYLNLLELDPGFCYALYNLAALLQSQKDPSFQSYALRYQNTCQ